MAALPLVGSVSIAHSSQGKYICLGECAAVCPYIPNGNKKSMARSNYVYCYGANSLVSKTAWWQIKRKIKKLRATKEIVCGI